MAHPHKVIHSVNLHGDAICVDVFERSDGSFGFDEFRRDAEDARGWFSIGHYGLQSYASEADAVHAATRHVSWFDGV